MKNSPLSCRVLGFIGVMGLAACTWIPGSDNRPMGSNVLSREAIDAAMAGRVDFVRHVKPVLENKCVMCHNRRSLPGYMSLENRREAKRTGALGSFIVAGHPEHSLLIAKVHGGYPAMKAMPAAGLRLTSEEKAILTKWVKEGASWPSGAAGTLRIDH